MKPCCTGRSTTSPSPSPICRRRCGSSVRCSSSSATRSERSSTTQRSGHDLTVNINEANGTAFNIWQAEPELAGTPSRCTSPACTTLPSTSSATSRSMPPALSCVARRRVLDGPGEFPFGPGGYYAVYFRGPDRLEIRNRAHAAGGTASQGARPIAQPIAQRVAIIPGVERGRANLPGRRGAGCGRQECPRSGRAARRFQLRSGKHIQSLGCGSRRARRRRRLRRESAGEQSSRRRPRPRRTRRRRRYRTARRPVAGGIADARVDESGTDTETFTAAPCAARS